MAARSCLAALEIPYSPGLQGDAVLCNALQQAEHVEQKNLTLTHCPLPTLTQHLQTRFLVAEVWQGPCAAQWCQAKHTERRGGLTALEWLTYYTKHHVPGTAASS